MVKEKTYYYVVISPCNATDDTDFKDSTIICGEIFKKDMSKRDIIEKIVKNWCKSNDVRYSKELLIGLAKSNKKKNRTTLLRLSNEPKCMECPYHSYEHPFGLKGMKQVNYCSHKENDFKKRMYVSEMKPSPPWCKEREARKNEERENRK